MSRRVMPHLLSLALMACAVGVTKASPLSSIAEINALSDAQFAEHLDIAASGTVVMTDRTISFIVQDGEESLIAVMENDIAPPLPGAVVRIHGKTLIDENLARTVLVSSFVRVGTAAIPQPRDISPSQLHDPSLACKVIRTSGTVLDAFPDEIDFRWDLLVLRGNGETFLASVPRKDIPDDHYDRLIGASVLATGFCHQRLSERRIFSLPRLILGCYDDLRIIKPVSPDPFSVPVIEFSHHVSPETIVNLGRRRAIGTVLAIWGGNRFLLASDDNGIICVTTTHGTTLPTVDDRVEVVGFPETDLFHINLSRAIFRRLPERPRTRREEPLDTTAESIMMLDGKPCIQTYFHGRLIRLSGTVRSISKADKGIPQINLECGQFLVPVDCSATAYLAKGIGIGFGLSVTGICFMETDNWHSGANFPRVRGFTIIPRSAADIRILSRPPWWTPKRLLIVIGSLLAALLGILAWNRVLNRIVERRSRELMREEVAHAEAELRTEERTRLSVELHDTIAQNLTGIAMQVDAAETAAEGNPADALPYLRTVRMKLRSCRENLRECMWDLRNRAFEEQNLGDAILKTVRPHAADAKLDISCDIPTDRLDDTTVHAVLCILRELVINAVRHGQAKHIRIAADENGGRLDFTVSDDGCGFDPETRPGVADGHFGLQGVDERIRRLGGTFTITSIPGQGCKADIRGLTTCQGS